MIPSIFRGRRKPPAAVVGLSVFLALTLGTTAILFSTIAGTAPSNGVGYRAVFSDATRLLPGDDVRIAGVSVGRVVSVSLGSGNTADVGFTVRGSIRLPASTIATIRYRDLVGSRYISLAVGPAANVGILPPGGELSLSHTRPALDLTTLLNGFQPLFNVLNPKQVNQLAGELVSTLQGEGGNLASILASTAGISQAVAGREDLIARVVDNLNAVLGTVDGRDVQLRGLVDDLSSLSTAMAADNQVIGGGLDGIESLTASTASLLDQARPPITRDLASLSVAAREFAKTRGDLQQLLDRLPIKLNAFTRAGSYGAYLNFFVCSLDITLTLPGLPSVTAPGLKNNEELCRR